MYVIELTDDEHTVLVTILRRTVELSREREQDRWACHDIGYESAAVGQAADYLSGLHERIKNAPQRVAQ